MTSSTPLITTFVVYILVILGIAAIASRHNRNLADYVLASRHLTGPLAALGAGASDMSAWLLLALPGVVMVHGINQIWLPIGLALGAYANWQFVAKRLRVYTEVANDSVTIPAYLTHRFADKRQVLGAVTAGVILVFFVVYSAAGLVAQALLIKIVAHIPYPMALLISAAIIFLYTFIGGFLAISWIDLLQGTLMFFALVLVPVATFYHLGGWQPTMNIIGSHNLNYLNAFHDFHALAIISLLAWGLGYCGQPHIIVRFMAAKSVRVIPLAQTICMTWMVIALYGAVMVGLGGIAFFHPGELADPETVFLQLAHRLFNPWLAGIMLAAVLSASMSTISAQLLVSSSAIAEDFYHALIRQRASNRELLWVSRLAVLVVSLAALYLASQPGGSILKLTQYAWSGLGAAIGPLILCSLYYRNMTLSAAVTGMLSGALVVIIWHILAAHYQGIFALNEIVPGFVANLAMIGLVSHYGKPAPAAVTTLFDQAHARLKMAES